MVVSCDYINEITETNVLTKREEKIKAPLLSKYHYRQIKLFFSLNLLHEANVK